MHVNYVEQNEKKQLTQRNKLVTQSWQDWESSNLLVLTSFIQKNLLQLIPKSPTFSSSFCGLFIQISLLAKLNGFINFITNKSSQIHPPLLLYFQKVPGACLFLDSIYMIHLSIKWNTSCEDFRLTVGRSRITPFLLLYFQEVPGACLRMDSVYIIHLSTNWDTSYEGSTWQLASEK